MLAGSDVAICARLRLCGGELRLWLIAFDADEVLL
jgi:hypothetical protein